MDYITDDAMRKIEDDIGKKLVELSIKPSTLFFDTTNFFTYIEHGEDLPTKGKSKDKRIKVHSFLCVMGLVFYRLLLWKLKKQEEMLSETRAIEELEKIRVVLVKRGDKEPQFMFETMGLDQMRLFTALGLETVLKETRFESYI
jgi:transposase